ncbi:HNH endonuclease [Candidatus Pacearchaeota archaeon]|nr:HNH endonuclease [Candidatus Pacearchaeota archaeon]
MKISNESIRKIYNLAKQVNSGNLSRKEALEICRGKKIMGTGSAQDYIQNFKYMLSGFPYKRTMNLYGTEYFLRQIYNDLGQSAFEVALNATQSHVTYYNSLDYGKQKQTQKLVDKLTKEFSVSSSGRIYPDEIADDPNYLEGAKKTTIVNAYERNSAARNKCIEHYGFDCAVCKFNFSNKYGRLGVGFIHVHHLVDLAEVDTEYHVDPIKDLRPVCPNCHAMLHKRKPSYSITELQSYLSEKNNSKST